MMSSLVPGSIFYTSGLNRKSTPTPPNATPSELDHRYKRTDFDGRAWPHDSPVTRAYDVANTSTKLIILNNKYGQGSTRLRGYYTGPSKSDRFVDPNRHRAKSPRNPETHAACYDSSSPRFVPKIKTDLEWVNSSERPPNSLIERQVGEKRSKIRSSSNADTFSVDMQEIDIPEYIDQVETESHDLVKTEATKSSVNARRHMSCIVPSEPVRLPGDRPHSRMSLPPARYFSEFADLSVGEKIYLWSIEKIYNVENLKHLKQDQYRKLLQVEAKKGHFSVRQYEKYLRYINSAGSRSHGTGSPSDKRARSGYTHRSGTSGRTSPTKSETRNDKDDDKPEQPPRPHTSAAHTREQPLEDSKSRSSSASSVERKPITPASKSPSPSRKSSAKSTRSNKSVKSIYSNRSNNSIKSNTKSKNSSRASSAKSAKSAKSSTGSKGDNSDSSDKNEEQGEVTQKHHVEGRDRPKSRLGHPGDADKESIHSSMSSIYSDKYESSQDSGVDKGDMDTNQKTKSQDSSSNSSKEERTDSKVSLKSEKSSDSNSAKYSINNTKNKKLGSKSEKAAPKDVKIHRVPSAGFVKPEGNDDKEESKEEKAVKQSADERKDEDKKEIDDSNDTDSNDDVETAQLRAKQTDQPKENQSLDSVKIENSNSTESFIDADETPDKQEQKRDAGAWDSADETDNANLEKSTNKPKLDRQDSFDEDDDRRVNKDVDKIEY